MVEIDEAGRPRWTRFKGGPSTGSMLKWQLFYWRDPDGACEDDGWTIALFDDTGDCVQAMVYPDLESAILKWYDMGGFCDQKTSTVNNERE